MQTSILISWAIVYENEKKKKKRKTSRILIDHIVLDV